MSAPWIKDSDFASYGDDFKKAISSYMVLFNTEFWKRNRTRDDLISAYLTKRFGLKEVDSISYEGVPLLTWIKRLNDCIHSSRSRNDYRKYFDLIVEELTALTGSNDAFCVMCGCRDLAKLEVDHIVPVSLGGTDRLTNLQLLCKSCNSSKNNEFLDCIGQDFKLVCGSSISAKSRYRALINNSVSKGRFKLGECVLCGKNASQSSLSVRLVDPILAATVCNLTVCCENCRKGL